MHAKLKNNTQSISYRQKRFFSLLIECQKMTNTLSRAQVFTMSTIYFIIIGYNTTSTNRLKRIIDSMFVEPFLNFLIVFLSSFVFAMVCLQTFLVTSYLNDKKRPMVQFITVNINCAFLDIISPFLIMELASVISDYFATDKGSLGYTALGASFCIVGILALLILQVLLIRIRCTIPGLNYRTQVSSSLNCVFYSSISICQVLCSFRDSLFTTNKTAYMFLTCLSSSIIILALYMSGYYRLYWNVSINQFIVKNLARILVVKTCSEVIHEDFMTLGIIMILVLQGFFAKLADTASMATLQIDVFDNDVTLDRKYIGMMLLNHYLSYANLKDYSGYENDLCLYYTGLWYSTMDSGVLAKKFGRREVLPRDGKPFGKTSEDLYEVHHSDLFKLVRFFESRPLKKALYFKILSLLQVTELMSFFRTSREVNSSFQGVKGKGLFSQFESFQLQLLWEARLHAMDHGKVKLESGTRNSVFDNFALVALVMESVETWQDSTYIDTRRTFESIETFGKLSASVEKIMRTQLLVFDTLHQEPNVHAVLLCTMNKSTLSSRLETSQFIDRLVQLEDASNLFSYYYPTIICYYSLLKYDVEKADSYVMMYKKKLNGLLNSTSEKKTKPQSNMYNMEVDSVAIRVALERENLGTITDLSYNSNHFLGQPEEVTAIGKSANVILPEAMAEDHLRAMGAFDAVKVLNKQREVLIKDFSGILKQVGIEVKLAPSVTKPVSSFCLLTFGPQSKGPNVLMDSSLGIVSADATFIRILTGSDLYEGEYKSGSINLKDLSVKFYASLKLLMKLNKYFSKINQIKIPNSNESKAEQMSEKLLSVLSMITDNNKNTGIIYDVGADSMLATLLGQPNIHARFEFVTILGKEYLKGFVSRKSNMRTTGLLFDPNEGEKAKLEQKKSAIMNQSSQDHQIDAASDDVATNKAIIEVNQQVVEYNSEQKESLVNKDRFAKVFDAETNEYSLNRFEDLLSPMVEAIEGLLTRLGIKKKSIEPISDENLREEKSMNLEEKVAEEDNDDDVNEIMSLIREFQRAGEPEKKKLGLSPVFGKTALISSMSMIDNSQNLELDKRGATLGEELNHLERAPTGLLSSNYQLKVNDKPIRKVNLLKPSIIDRKKILLESPSLIKSRQAEQKSLDIKMQDPLAWLKQKNKSANLTHMKSSMSLGTIELNGHSVPVPNIATHKTMSRIISLFGVVFYLSGERRYYYFDSEQRESVCSEFSGNDIKRLEKNGAQEVWSKIQQRTEDYQP